MHACVQANGNGGVQVRTVCAQVLEPSSGIAVCRTCRNRAGSKGGGTAKRTGIEKSRGGVQVVRSSRRVVVAVLRCAYSSA